MDELCWLVHRWWGQLLLLAAIVGGGYLCWERGLKAGAELPFSTLFRRETRRRLDELDRADRNEALAERQALAAQEKADRAPRLP